MNEQDFIGNYLRDYILKKKFPIRKSGKVLMLQCPECNLKPQTKGMYTMVVPPGTNMADCHSCGKKRTIFELVKLYETNLKTNEDVIEFLRTFLGLKLMTPQDISKIDAALSFYEKSGFDLVPIAKNDKIPIETGWTQKSHKSIEEWKQWITTGLNIGLKTGAKSNVMSLDIDILSKLEKTEYFNVKTTPERRTELLTKRSQGIEKVLKILGEEVKKTFIQESLGGMHLFFKYDKDIPKTHINIDDIVIDIEAEGGYILMYPSTINNYPRKIDEFRTILPLPDSVRKMVIDKIGVPLKTESEDIKEAIANEDFKINPEDFKLRDNNLSGVCNSTFIKLGGIFRKQLNSEETGYVLNVLNKHLLERPMEQKAINAMIRSLGKYTSFDEVELANKIMLYMKDVESASRAEISLAIMGVNKGEDKIRIDKALGYLVKESKILKKGTKYILLRRIDWGSELSDIFLPLDFKMPYFAEIANFEYGDLILIGSKTKFGKTHIAMNIIKKLVAQNITPKYISLESGSRFKKIALQLGMKDGDFDYNKEWVDPLGMELTPKSVTIVDWLCPENFADVDKYFRHFTEQLAKTKGILIVFMQLREDTANFFANNLVKQFPALGVRYLYDDEKDGTYGKFIIDTVRDAKFKMKTWEIPCKYNWDTKELEIIKETEANTDMSSEDIKIEEDKTKGNIPPDETPEEGQK